MGEASGAVAADSGGTGNNNFETSGRSSQLKKGGKLLWFLQQYVVHLQMRCRTEKKGGGKAKEIPSTDNWVSI